MGEVTGISWADSTFNPWIGCEKVSPGCAHCYAETLVTGRMGQPDLWGAEGSRRRTVASNWAKPVKWNRDHEAFLADHGHKRRVFCASLADVFEPRPELDPWREDLFQLIHETPNLEWLLLTKRPDVARDWLAGFYDRSDDAFGHAAGVKASWPMPSNLWLGVSIENSRFTWRADVLREIPAAIRFISAEPLLGSLYESDSALRLSNPRVQVYGGSQDGLDLDVVSIDLTTGRNPLDLKGIDWVIIGGESGPGARPFHVQHALEILWYAEESYAPAMFVKQLGAKPLDVTGYPMSLAHRKGEDRSEWPHSLRIQEFPR